MSEPSNPVTPRYVDLQGTMEATGGVESGPPKFSRERCVQMVEDLESVYHGEDPYVAYLWEMRKQTGDGDASQPDSDGGTVVCFRIKPADLALFPELVGIDKIFIYESMDGTITQL